MLVGQDDAGVDEGSRLEVDTVLFAGQLEGELREEGEGCVRVQLNVVEVGGGVVDLAYY